MNARVVPKGLGLASLRERLEGKLLDARCLSKFRIGSRDKGKWGKANERLAGCVHRPNSITDSGPSRSPVPKEADHRFRSMPIAERTPR